MKIPTVLGERFNQFGVGISVAGLRVWTHFLIRLWAHHFSCRFSLGFDPYGGDRVVIVEIRWMNNLNTDMIVLYRSKNTKSSFYHNLII